MIALAGWAAGGLLGLGWLGFESSRAPIEVGRAASATAGAEHVDASRAPALGEHSVSVAKIMSGSAASSDLPLVPVTHSPLFAAASPTDPVQTAVGRVE